MSAWLDACVFTPTLGGTTDWVVSLAVQGYNSPALAGAVNGTVYAYRAESADLSQWEIGFGAYTVSTTTLARTSVLSNSAGTGTAAGQSGAGTKISFLAAPRVAIVALKEDLLSVQEANAFTSAQQLQAANNLLVPTGAGAQSLSAAQQSQARANLGGLAFRRQVFTASGTFTTPAGSSTSTIYEFQLVGGGGSAGSSNSAGVQAVTSGAGSGGGVEGSFTGVAPSTAITITIGAAGTTSGTAGGNGVAGGSSAIGAPVSANAGGGQPSFGSSTANAITAPGSGGSASGGDLPVAGCPGQWGSNMPVATSNQFQGGNGGNAPFGLGFGGIGAGSNVTVTGGNATGFGAGGGGAEGLGGAGGLGSPGVCIIRWVL